MLSNNSRGNNGSKASKEVRERLLEDLTKERNNIAKEIVNQFLSEGVKLTDNDIMLIVTRVNQKGSKIVERLGLRMKREKGLTLSYEEFSGMIKFWEAHINGKDVTKASRKNEETRTNNQANSYMNEAMRAHSQAQHDFQQHVNTFNNGMYF